MVQLTIKKSSESITFLFETVLSVKTGKVLSEVIRIRNGIAKIQRLAGEIRDLSEYGVAWPPERRGLAPEQALELKIDPNVELSQNYPLRDQETFEICPDPLHKRSGLAPSNPQSRRILIESSEAALNLSKSEPIKWEHLHKGLKIIEGAISIVYPKGIPSYDPARAELENTEVVDSTGLWDSTIHALWFASKIMKEDEPLSTYLGKNEKTKCIIKVGKRGEGPPPKENPLTEEEEKRLLLEQHKRMETLKKLAKDEDEYSSPWADGGQLKRKFQGLNNIDWKSGL